MNPDGSGRFKIPVPAGLTWAWGLAWSPDASQLAFTCQVDGGTDDVCLVNADGTGFRRLTNDAATDGSPDWKPDGSQIAFHTNRFGPVYEIVLVNPDGTGVTRLIPDIYSLEPAWLPDGQKIAFTGNNGVFVMNADGTGRTRLTIGADSEPAWRP
jgi:TolB protein